MRPSSTLAIGTICALSLLSGGCPSSPTDGTSHESGLTTWNQTPVDVSQTPTDATPDDPNDPNDIIAAREIEPILPEAITLDVPELPEDTEVEGIKLTQAAPLEVSEGVYEHIAHTAGTVVHRFHRFADRSLALAARIYRDLDDPNQTQLTGSFHVAGETYEYKADFAAFDIDGDGADDGSGNAVDLPIAVRIWVDSGSADQRFLCALVTERPSTDHVGAGEIYVEPYLVRATQWSSLQIHVTYDRTDDAHKWNVADVAGRIHDGYALDIGQARVDVRSDPNDVVEKTVRAAFDFNRSPYSFGGFQAATHWTPGGDVFLVSAAAPKGKIDNLIDEVCVSRDDFQPTDDAACADFDTQDIELLDMPTPGAAAFPASFPQQPTF